MVQRFAGLAFWVVMPIGKFLVPVFSKNFKNGKLRNSMSCMALAEVCLVSSVDKA